MLKNQGLYKNIIERHKFILIIYNCRKFIISMLKYTVENSNFNME
ncbi:hypothetical protein ND00_32670 [Clostridium sp. L74]|nr:hypothetical protein ND00_32670 [Clostridium sp. L74]